MSNKLDVQGTRENIKDKTRDYLINGDPAFPLVVSVYPGGGKTTNILAVVFGYHEEIKESERVRIDDGPPFKVVYLPPRHEVIQEAVDKIYHDDFVWFQSRLRECNHPEVRKLLLDPALEDKSYFPVEYFCHYCEYRYVPKRDIILEGGQEATKGIASRCPYEIKKHAMEGWEMPTWAGVHHHILTYLKKYLDSDVEVPGRGRVKRESVIDAVIIEENPMKVLLETQKLDVDTLSHLRDEIDRFRWYCETFRERVDNMDFSNHVNIYRDIVEFLLGELDATWTHPSKKSKARRRTTIAPDETHLGMFPARPMTRWEKLQESVTEWRLLDWDDFDAYWVRFLGKRMFEDIEKTGMDEQASLAFKPTIDRLRYIGRALGGFHRMLSKMFEVSTQDNLKYHFAIVDENWTADRDVYINANVFHGDIIPSIRCKVIALDGTGDKMTWDRIFNKNIPDINFVPKLGFYPNVTRVTWRGDDRQPSMYYQSSYIKDGVLRETGQNMLELAALIIKSYPGRTAVIGSMAIEKFLVDICNEANVPKDKYIYDHYYNITSKNTMQQCDTIITLSTPLPPVIQLEASVKLSGWPAEVWERHYVDSEMIQAIARVRPVLETRPTGYTGLHVQRDNPVRIFVFGSRDIFSGGREKELVMDEYREITPAALEGKLKYGGDGSIKWTKAQLRAVAPIMACFGASPLTQKEIQDITKLAWSPVKTVTGHLVKLGMLARDKNKLVMVKKQ